MNDNLTVDALDYLLDEMDEVRRAAFEARLDADPAAEAVLKATADTMGGFALAAAAPVNLPADERAGLARAVVNAAHSHEGRRGRRTGWVRWAWPTAAAILFSFNLWQFFRPPVVGVLGPRGVPHRATSAPDSVPAGAAGSAPATPASNAMGGTSAASAPEPGRSGTSPAAKVAPAEVGRLLTELRALRLSHAQLEAERRRLAALVAVQSGAGRGSLVAMELVDPERFARGERKGLLAMVQTLGTEPVDDAGAVARDGMSIAAVGVLPPSSSSSADVGVEVGASAWSLFDTAKHEGLVTLHQLPAIPAGEQLSLWVRAETEDTFRRVGEIPAALYGGSGTVYVTLDPQATAPDEVMVTREDKGSLPETPGPDVVLRGP